MIGFRPFVSAIHNAILEANDALMKKNEELLDRYFDRKRISGSLKEELIPKTVTLKYPQAHNFSDSAEKDIKDDYVVEVAPIEVPLVTLVPLSMTQVEKVTLTTEFEMEIIDDELQLNFVAKKRTGIFGKSEKSTHTKLEIVLSPQESSEGLKLLVEGYEDFLRKQIS